MEGENRKKERKKERKKRRAIVHQTNLLRTSHNNMRYDLSNIF